jgi:hypothetical protein
MDRKPEGVLGRMFIGFDLEKEFIQVGREGV